MNKPGRQQIFGIAGDQEFNDAALAIFRFQAEKCAVYREFIRVLGIRPEDVRHSSEIPFLPIGFFKTQVVTSASGPAELTFSSSGTTGMNSYHHVSDSRWYEDSFRNAFNRFYGDVGQYCLLALLPSYLERKDSSLLYMVDDLIHRSGHPQSGFYLYNHGELYTQLQRQQKNEQRCLLIGVSFALLDFAEEHTLNFPELIVMETGGMKGRRKEIVREDLHNTLKARLGVATIHSEYGMTELLSQAYSASHGRFYCPPWMRVSTRDTNDPLSILGSGETGAINITDLANVNSCSFIATQDLGKIYADGSFEVLGRFDHSDIRGCNLLLG